MNTIDLDAPDSAREIAADVTTNKANLQILRESSSSLTVNVARTDKEFDELGPEWKDLAEDSDCSVFQTFEWQRSWWRHYGNGRKLNMLVFEDGGGTVGIAPMFQDRVKLLGVPLARRLQFFSEWYVDIIAHRERRQEVVDALAAYLYSTRREWDVFEMGDVNERFPILNELPARMEPRGFKAFSYRGNTYLETVLAPTWKGFLHDMGKERQHRYNRRLKKLEENFQYEYEEVGKGADEIAAAIDDFAEIYRKRWNSFGYESDIGDTNTMAFHREVARDFADRGWLRILFLKVNGNKVAAAFNFSFHNRIYGYQSNVYAPPEVMKCSPGLLLHYEVVRRGIEERMEVLDFLRGNQAYKMEEFECRISSNWQLRIMLPEWTKGGRFRILVIADLLKKASLRIASDYRAFRRLRMTKGLFSAETARFMRTEFGELRAKCRLFLSSYFAKRGRVG